MSQHAERPHTDMKSIVLRAGGFAYCCFLLVSQIVRIVLMAKAGSGLTWDSSLFTAWWDGLLFDLATAVFAALPWMIATALVPRKFATSRAGSWSLAAVSAVWFSLLLFISTAEWFFWDEFSARFNFIAVDYLVFTQEVWGNISESYPMPWIIAGIAAVGSALAWLLVRSGIFAWIFRGNSGWKSRIAPTAVGIAIAVVTALTVRQAMLPDFANPMNEEIAKNGCWSFFAAFHSMELDYEKNYARLGDAESAARARLLLHPSPGRIAPASEKRWNVVTICMESMSGSYMARFGNTDNLTPCLDQLARSSLFFSDYYATGTRTVRGMEAITLSLPPTPGQAILYRPDGTHLRTSFTPFLNRGYDCAFLYGGDGRFDFMNRYYSTTGCRILDANAWKPADTTFKTAWGACDDDLYRKTLAEADADHAAGRPFHFFIMTTSNHRPYDFPAGRIDLPSHGRKAAVRYADQALGDFIAAASKKPWFANTVFVISADHCASSAGKMDLDVTKYLIPGMIHAPALVPAREITGLCSQIDLMPTVFGLLRWDTASPGYGVDVLATPPRRAFVSNYQKIALLRDDSLTILKPNGKIDTYHCNPASGELLPISPSENNARIADTIFYYQSASRLFRSGGLKLGAPPAETSTASNP